MQALLSRSAQGERESTCPRNTSVPVTYIVFDILEKDKKSLYHSRWSNGGKSWNRSVTEGPHVILSVPVEGKGEDYYRAAVARGLEGVMAKRMDSPYEPGPAERQLAENKGGEDL